MPREAYCSVCGDTMLFSKCWLRVEPVRVCPGCHAVFETPSAPYRKRQPVCPTCEEPMEHPGFEYGVCDGCGSKFELVEGAKPGWLPNAYQRELINRTGRSWSPD